MKAAGHELLGLRSLAEVILKEWRSWDDPEAGERDQLRLRTALNIIVDCRGKDRRNRLS